MESRPSTSALRVAAPFTTRPCLFTVTPLVELGAGARTSIEGDALRSTTAARAYTHTHARAHALPFPPLLLLLRAAPLRYPRARGRECTSSLIPLPLHPVLLASATHARADAHARTPLSPSPFTLVVRLTATPRAYARTLILPLPLHPRAEPVRYPGFGGEPFWCSLLLKGFS